MHIARERRQVITIELGLMEAEAIVRLLHQTHIDEQLILAQLRDRLEYNVQKAKEGS